MPTVWRSICSVAFGTRADRDKFRDATQVSIEKILNEHGLTAYARPVNPEAQTRNNQWFDGDTLDAVWAVVSIVDFISEADRATFWAAYKKELQDLADSVEHKDSAFWFDKTGKCSAINATEYRVPDAEMQEIPIIPAKKLGG